MTEHTPISTRRFAAASLCAGTLAAVALVDQRAGLGLLLVALAIGTAVALAGALPRSRYTLLLIALAGGLAAMAVVRSTPWLVALDLGAAFAVFTLAVLDARTWGGLWRAAPRVAQRLPATPRLVARATGVGALRGRKRGVLVAARGLALGVSLAFVFGALFASADAAFAQLASDTFETDIAVDVLVARLIVFTGVVALCAALALAGLGRTREPEREKGPERPATEWVIALAILDTLFIAFVVVQLRVLFGGDRHVLDTAGLSYAEYAREGFYQLLVVAFLTLAVVAVAGRRRGAQTGRRPTLVEVLLGVLCVLTLIVLVSALRRLGLLEDAYGFTIPRLLGHTATLWVGVVLALVFVAGLTRNAAWLPRALVALSAAGLLGFSLANPERLVARENVHRYERTGKLDIAYVASLGPDSTPALSALPPRTAACVLAEVSYELREGDGVFELNVARARARRALAGLEPGSCP